MIGANGDRVDRFGPIRKQHVTRERKKSWLQSTISKGNRINCLVSTRQKARKEKKKKQTDDVLLDLVQRCLAHFASSRTQEPGFEILAFALLIFLSVEAREAVSPIPVFFVCHVFFSFFCFSQCFFFYSFVYIFLLCFFLYSKFVIFFNIFTFLIVVRLFFIQRINGSLFIFVDYAESIRLQYLHLYYAGLRCHCVMLAVKKP